MKTIRWGILGTGAIARKFASDLSLIKDAELIAVGSRSKESAEAFSTLFPVLYCHASYEDLARNPDVDVIYIASPHSYHYEHTLLCLGHGKAVLCEKPFAINLRQATEMIRAAREKNVFLMEGMWTRFLPHFIKAKELIAEGQLGDIRSVLVNFGFRANPDPSSRLFSPELGGGSLLDIGVYNVFVALQLLGRPERIDAWITPAVTGVDEQCSVIFRYDSGAMAQLFSSLAAHLGTEADIAGTKGRIRLTSRFYEPSAGIELYNGKPDSRRVIYIDGNPGLGFRYEAEHVGDCLRQGLTESPVMGFSDTLLLMETLDTIRKIAGIRYPVDQAY